MGVFYALLRRGPENNIALWGAAHDGQSAMFHARQNAQRRARFGGNPKTRRNELNEGMNEMNTQRDIVAEMASAANAAGIARKRVSSLLMNESLTNTQRTELDYIFRLLYKSQVRLAKMQVEA